MIKNTGDKSGLITDNLIIYDLIILKWHTDPSKNTQCHVHINSLRGNLSESIESKVTAVLQKHKRVFRYQVYKCDWLLLDL